MSATKASFIIANMGAVDSGKSSLVARILKELDVLKEGEWQQDQHQLTDSLQFEREQNITFSVGHRFFDLELDRPIRIHVKDDPGHLHLLGNTVSGLYGCDLVLYVVDAVKPDWKSLDLHLKVLEFLELKNILVLINKVDLLETEILTGKAGNIKRSDGHDSVPIVTQSAEEKPKGVLENTKHKFKEIPVIDFIPVSAITGHGVNSVVQKFRQFLSSPGSLSEGVINSPQIILKKLGRSHLFQVFSDQFEVSLGHMENLKWYDRAGKLVKFEWKLFSKLNSRAEEDSKMDSDLNLKAGLIKTPFLIEIADCTEVEYYSFKPELIDHAKVQILPWQKIEKTDFELFTNGLKLPVQISIDRWSVTEPILVKSAQIQFSESQLLSSYASIYDQESGNVIGLLKFKP